MLFFDGRGHLTPYTLIPTDWDTFVNTFGWNQHRLTLVESLNKFIDALQALSITSFTLWIDGSFVTGKEKPNDIDVVLFLPTTDHRVHEQKIRQLRDQFGKLDLYIVRKIAEGERDHFLFLSDYTEWLFQFTTTRPDKRTHRKYPKGFIELVWSDE